MGIGDEDVPYAADVLSNLGGVRALQFAQLGAPLDLEEDLLSGLGRDLRHGVSGLLVCVRYGENGGQMDGK